MRGGENTSQAASVEFVRRRRTNYARSRLQAFLSENKMFSDSQKIPERLLRDLSMLYQRMIALINGAAGGASGVIV